MASMRIPAPGTEYGPCEGDCYHTDCEINRETAEAVCRFCGQPIGYEVSYYTDPQQTPHAMRQYVHAVCLEQDSEPADDLPTVLYRCDANIKCSDVLATTYGYGCPNASRPCAARGDQIMATDEPVDPAGPYDPVCPRCGEAGDDSEPQCWACGAAYELKPSLDHPRILDQYRDVVLAYTGARNCQPFVTWRIDPYDKSATPYYGGHYYTSEQAARADFAKRTGSDAGSAELGAVLFAVSLVVWTLAAFLPFVMYR